MRMMMLTAALFLTLGNVQAQTNSLLKKTGATPKSNSLQAKGVTPRSVKPAHVSAVIKWHTWEEVQELNKKEKRKILVDVYTEWCGWCKKMDANTFSNPALARYLNENFYLVKLNAEQKEALSYKDKEYGFVKTARGGYHELAAELLQGRLSFPSLVFMDENMELIQPIPGYREADELLKISSYIGSNSYREVPWSVYEREYKQPEGFKE
jgi:thioredoxin-related protein